MWCSTKLTILNDSPLQFWLRIRKLASPGPGFCSIPPLMSRHSINPLAKTQHRAISMRRDSTENIVKVTDKKQNIKGLERLCWTFFELEFRRNDLSALLTFLGNSWHVDFSSKAKKRPFLTTVSTKDQSGTQMDDCWTFIKAFDLTKRKTRHRITRKRIF